MCLEDIIFEIIIPRICTHPVSYVKQSLIYLFVSFMNVSLPSTVTQATHKLHHNIVMERKYRETEIK